MTPTVDAAQVFDELIAPTLFRSERSHAAPTLTVVVSQPGTGSARVAARLATEQAAGNLSSEHLHSFLPEFLDLARSRQPAAEDAGETVAEWVQAALTRALTEQRSLVFDGTFRTPETAIGLSRAFQDAGFATRLEVVTSRKAESLLSTISRYLRARERRLPARFTSLDQHERGWTQSRAIVTGAGAESGVDRLRVLARDGSPLFDSQGTPAVVDNTTAIRAFDGVERAPWTNPAGAAWFSELRRVTEYARSSGNLSSQVGSVLLDLHSRALNEVLPNLPLRAGSSVAVEQERRIASELVQLRRSVPAPETPKPRIPPAPIHAPTRRTDGPSL